MREFMISTGPGGGGTGVLNASGTAIAIWANPATAPSVNIEFLRYWAGFTTNATSAQQRIAIVTATSSFPQTSSAFTPSKLKIADPNASVLVGDSTGTAGTCAVNCSVYNSATFTVVHQDGFNVLNGWLHVPTPPETRILPANSATIASQVGTGLWFPVSPGTNSGWSYGTIYREI